MSSIPTLATHETVAAPVDGPRYWPARLDLALAQREGRTRLVRNRHQGPLRLQRPFYPEPRDCAHLYILHPPGGLVSGDDLQIQVEAGPGSHALLTTPSAGKVYRVASTGEAQRQTTWLRLEEGARLEWLPQDNIVFDGARGELGLRVDVAPNARFFGWETTCLGRAAGARPFCRGGLLQRLELYREGRPWLLERTPLQATPALLDSPWALAGHRVYGTVIGTLTHLPARQQEEILALTRGQLDDTAAATVTRDLLLVRLMGHDSEQLREQLLILWQALRPALMERPACAPRIWAT